MTAILPCPVCGTPLQRSLRGTMRDGLLEHLELVHWLPDRERRLIAARALHPANMRKADA